MTVQRGDCRHGFHQESCPLCCDTDFDSKTVSSDEQQPAVPTLHEIVSPLPDHEAYGGGGACTLKLQDVENITPEQKESVFLESLGRMERVLQLRRQFDELLGRGTFGITQARYSLGHGRVGQAQYPGVFKATARLKVSGERQADTPQLEVVDVRCPTKSEHSSKIVSTDPPAQISPLKWFGVAVPPPLRTAQKDFQEALKVAAMIAQEHIAMQGAMPSQVKHESD